MNERKMSTRNAVETAIDLSKGDKSVPWESMISHTSPSPCDPYHPAAPRCFDCGQRHLDAADCLYPRLVEAATGAAGKLNGPQLSALRQTAAMDRAVVLAWITLLERANQRLATYPRWEPKTP